MDVTTSEPDSATLSEPESPGLSRFTDDQAFRSKDVIEYVHYNLMAYNINYLKRFPTFQKTETVNCVKLSQLAIKTREFYYSA